MRVLLFALFLLAPGLATAGDSESRSHGRDLGFSYQNDRDADVPWSIHIIKIDRANTDLELHTTLASNTVLGLAPLPDQIKGLPSDIGRPLAAVNGDFYRDDRTYGGDPKGLQIMQGELVSSPCDWSCFYIDAAGTPHLSNVTSHFVVKWPNGKFTELGFNEERNGKGAALYTPRMGSSTCTPNGREFVLERTGDGPWLPLHAGETYTARVLKVRDSGDTPLSSDTMVLSLNSQVASEVGEINPGANLKISLASTPDLHGVRTAIGVGLRWSATARSS